jgi:regulator of sigma E protease
MMSTVVGAIGAFVLLGIMLLVHEVGHFVAAKLSGITVEEFGFGYPPRLATLFRRGGTDYTLNLIPLGGFVRMKGEDDPEGPGSFVNASKRRRVGVLLAGAGMNLLLAVVMFSAAFLVGYPELRQGALVTRVLGGTAASEAGLLAGDVIQQTDDVVLRNWTDLADFVAARPNEPIELVVRRQGELLFLDAELRSVEGVGQLGIEYKPAVSLRRFPLHQALGQGLRLTGEFLWLTLSLPAILLRGGMPLEAARPVGPVGIYQLASSAAQYVLASGRWFAILELGGILNAAVALTNLLPLPGLDGGRLLFIIAEAIRGERVAPEREGAIHFIGMMVLLLVAVLITVQDVMVGVPVPDWSQLGL